MTTVAPRIVAGSASRSLAEAVARALGGEPVATELERYPDGEMRPAVDPVRGDDVFVVQSTCPPVSEHLVELLLLLDACRRAGAARLTAVVPYFGYARQDRRRLPGQPIGVRVALDALATAGAQRLVVVDPHTPALEAMATVPLEVLSAVPLLAHALGRAADRCVVAPDLGAVTLAERFAAQLGASVAVVRKHRITGSLVRAEELVGSVDGREVVLVDDMIATGGTLEAAARLVAEHGARPAPVVAAIHGLLVADAPERLARLAPARVLVTDTAAPPARAWAAGNGAGAALEVCSVAGLLADAIARLHREECLDDLELFA